MSRPQRKRARPRVLLVSANPNVPVPVPPYGLEIIAAALHEHLRAEVRIIDPFLPRPYTPSLSQALADFEPAVVGIGMRNLDIWYGCDLENRRVVGRSCIAELEQVAAMVLAAGFPPERILLGGAGFSIAAAELLQRVGLRFGVVGAGGKAAVDFVRAMVNGKAPAAIAGLVTVSGGSYQVAPPAVCAPQFDLDLVPRHLGVHRLILRTRNLPFPLRTSSGCGMRCIYCCESMSQPTPARPRDMKSIEEELGWLSKQGARRVILADGELNGLSQDHADRVIRLLQKYDLSWRAYCLPTLPTGDQIRRIRQSRCESLLLTVDSGSNSLLRNIGRPVDAARIRVSIDRHLAAEIYIEASILFGLPGETHATIEETIRLIHAYPEVVFNYACGARLYPNTPLAAHARERGWDHVYRAAPGDPLDIAVYCEPEAPWRLRPYLESALQGANNAHPFW